MVKKKLLVLVAMVSVMTMSITSVALAATPAPVDLTTVQTAVTSSISVGQIAAIIGACIAGGMGFALIWFGARKLFKTIWTAFRTGKIKF